jgi:hypothetical protein
MRIKNFGWESGCGVGHIQKWLDENPNIEVIAMSHAYAPNSGMMTTTIIYREAD